MNSGPEEKIEAEIRCRSRIIKDPAGRKQSVISEVDAVEIAGRFDCLPGDVYVLALQRGVWPHRYVRNHSALTISDQLVLAQSSVAVIGCGGLGGYAVLMMARAGIGSIRVVDPDIFEESNLNRQAFAAADTIGIHKTRAAAAAVRLVNPAVRIIEYPDALTAANALQILDGADVCVDALDNLPDRKMLLDQTRRKGIPLVHGAIAGFEGQVMTFSPDSNSGKNLFDHVTGDPEAETENAESVLGVFTVTPVLIASLQVMEVIKILLKKSVSHSARMLYADIESGEFNYFDFDS